MSAGKSNEGSFTVANYTDKPMTVKLFVKQFSVSDFTYSYTFMEPKDNWIKLSDNLVNLQPNQNKRIGYIAEVPLGTTPGDHDFTLFASADITGQSMPVTVQATSLLYLTVEGKLIRTTELRGSSIPFLVTGTDVAYKIIVENTGNVHISAIFFGQLEGLFVKQAGLEAGHLLIPGAPLSIEGSIPMPLLPGLYKITYGFKADDAQSITSKTAIILFIPPWSVIGIVLILMYGKWAGDRKRAGGAA